MSSAQVKDTSFIHIFSGILSRSCGIPACHDGSFEPHFNSIASSYNTLVYHPIVKNSEDIRFKYRVIPFDTANSVLYERITNCCFVNENDRMPFTIGDALSDVEINKIAKWIIEGAKSPAGDVCNKPASPPHISSECFVLGNDSIAFQGNDSRIDTLYYNPSLIPGYISTITFKFIVFSAPENTTSDSLVVFFELSENDFQSSPSKSIRLLKDGGHWLCTLNKRDLQKTNLIWYRVKVSYLSNQAVYFPNKNTEKYKRQHWSFIINE